MCYSRVAILNICFVFFFFSFFFFNDTATTEIYTLSLHDALPISEPPERHRHLGSRVELGREALRSEEHTSELQSHSDLVCRLLLEKKNDPLRARGRGGRMLERIARAYRRWTAGAPREGTDPRAAHPRRDGEPVLFFPETPAFEIYTLSLHAALPI